MNNYRLEHEAKMAEKELEYLKQRTTDVNRERKNFQVCFLHTTHCPCISDRSSCRNASELS